MQLAFSYAVVLLLSLFSFSGIAQAAGGCNESQIETFYDKAMPVVDKKGSYQEIGIQGTCSLSGRMKKLKKGYEFRFEVGALNEPRVVYFANKASFIERFKENQGSGAKVPVANNARLNSPAASAGNSSPECDFISCENSSSGINGNFYNPYTPLENESPADTVTTAQLMATPGGWGGTWSNRKSNAKSAAVH